MENIRPNYWMARWDSSRAGEIDRGHSVISPFGLFSHTRVRLLDWL